MIINIKKSIILTRIVFHTHAGALLLTLVLPITPGLRIGLAALICASLWLQRRYGRWARACEMQLEEDGTCIHTMGGEKRRYRIVRVTAQTGFVCFTLMRSGERTRTLLVLRDAVDPETYRALRAQIVQRRLPIPDQAQT